VVSKNTRNGRTFTDIIRITGEDRKIEIARMLSGDTNAVVSLKHAEELLERAGSSAGRHK
jgi:DNA repair protein RecN (Recombination protein N)